MIFVGVIFAGKPDMTGLPAGRGGTNRENMVGVVGELIRQVEYGICYKYVKYGG